MTNRKASRWLWYNSVLLSNENDQAINTVTNIEEFQVNYVKRKKPDSKGWKCMVPFIIHSEEKNERRSLPKLWMEGRFNSMSTKDSLELWKCSISWLGFHANDKIYRNVHRNCYFLHICLNTFLRERPQTYQEKYMTIIIPEALWIEWE